MRSTLLEILFWSSCGCVAYAYAFYPLMVALLARLRAPLVRSATPFSGTVSVVICAYNEERTIARRMGEFTRLAAAMGLPIEIIVVSDGSTDGTAGLVRAAGAPGVRLIELGQNVGKAEALSRGCAAASGDVLVFADARQRWADDALAELLRPFTNPQVGAAGGELELATDDGALAGVGLYWRYEKWLRRAESRLDSTVGVSGAISAVRRTLFVAVPRGTLLDDVYWPLCTVMQGYRVVHVAAAVAFDRLPADTHGEFRRKVRTLSGNFQLLARLPSVLNPFRNPVWIQFISHKLMRLVVPWALIGALLGSAALSGPFYRFACYVQLLFYGVALAGIAIPALARYRVVSAACSFVVLNAAAWLGFWIWATGRSASAWGKARYAREASPPPAA